VSAIRTILINGKPTRVRALKVGEKIKNGDMRPHAIARGEFYATIYGGEIMSERDVKTGFYRPLPIRPKAKKPKKASVEVRAVKAWGLCDTRSGNMLPQAFMTEELASKELLLTNVHEEVIPVLITPLPKGKKK